MGMSFLGILVEFVQNLKRNRPAQVGVTVEERKKEHVVSINAGRP
jgi:hypothetical protein